MGARLPCVKCYTWTCHKRKPLLYLANTRGKACMHACRPVPYVRYCTGTGTGTGRHKYVLSLRNSGTDRGGDAKRRGKSRVGRGMPMHVAARCAPQRASALMGLDHGRQ